jgi:hypothetical protein
MYYWYLFVETQQSCHVALVRSAGSHCQYLVAAILHSQSVIMGITCVSFVPVGGGNAVLKLIDQQQEHLVGDIVGTVRCGLPHQ